MTAPQRDVTPVHPGGADAVGPAYHPEDPEYLIRWHEHRGDVSDSHDERGNPVGPWRDESGTVIDHADFPPPAPTKAAEK